MGGFTPPDKWSCCPQTIFVYNNLKYLYCSLLNENMMIKSLLTTSVLFLCCCLNVYSQWTQMVFPDTNNVKAITFIDASTGFCTGQYFDAALGDYIGIIYKTTDAGLNWDTVLNTGLGNNYANDITFFNENIGYTSNRNDNFFRTSDGGASWDTLPFDGDNALWTAINLIDGNSGYSCGFSGEIIKFEDAGETVSTLYSSGVVMEICRDMVCLSSDTCYSLWANEILTTTNGGTTWQPIPTSDTTGNTGFYVFDDGTIVVFAKYESITCLRSTNDGASWELTPISATAAAINKVTFFEGTGYAVSADGKILHSIDSGRTWNVVPVITPNGSLTSALNDIILFNENTGFICGDDGVLLSLGLPTPLSTNSPPTITIAPNPANNLLTITCSTIISEIQVFSLTGACIYRENIYNLSAGIEVSKFPEGVYFVEVVLSDGEVVMEEVVVGR
jgi:photosystem II stability/assembly factor-like uncharacterized protein